MSKLKVLITVPHALSDKRAADSARALEDALVSQKIPYETFLGDIVRTEKDLNRYEGRDTPYRQRLREVISKAKEGEEEIILIDMHSFPNSPESFGVSLDSQGRGIVPKQVFLGPERYHRGLKEYFAGDIKAGRVKIPVGFSLKNDIVLEAVSMGITAFLVENNDDKAYFTDAEQMVMLHRLIDYIRRPVVETQTIITRVSMVVLQADGRPRPWVIAVIIVLLIILFAVIIWAVVRAAKRERMMSQAEIGDINYDQPARHFEENINYYVHDRTVTGA